MAAQRLRVDDKAACIGANPEHFFPESSTKHAVARHAYALKDTENYKTVINAVKALELCDSCSIQQKCLEYALESQETAISGIYGGTLEHERMEALGYKVPAVTRIMGENIRREANRRAIRHFVMSPMNGKEIPSCIETVLDK